MPLHSSPSVSLPVSVAAPMQELLHDPITGSTRYGAVSDLFTVLLRDWLKSEGVETLAEAIRQQERVDA